MILRQPRFALWIVALIAALAAAFAMSQSAMAATLGSPSVSRSFLAASSNSGDFTASLTCSTLGLEDMPVDAVETNVQDSVHISVW